MGCGVADDTDVTLRVHSEVVSEIDEQGGRDGRESPVGWDSEFAADTDERMGADDGAYKEEVHYQGFMIRVSVARSRQMAQEEGDEVFGLGFRFGDGRRETGDGETEGERARRRRRRWTSSCEKAERDEDLGLGFQFGDGRWETERRREKEQEGDGDSDGDGGRAVARRSRGMRI